MVGHYIHHDIYLTSIYAWRPCVAVPNNTMDKLHAAFYDMDMTEQQREAFQSLEACIF